MILNMKLHIPHVRNSLVSRPRLMSKLNEGLNMKLTVVSAQAGYGKTTALSEWVKQCNALVAWVSLDKQDNDWNSFWRYFTASINERVSGFGSTVWPLLENGPSMSSEPLITALLNELSQLNSELVIILDDYHSIELPAIEKSLTFMLEHLPAHIHLYIASRSDLAIPTTRLLAKGELLQISMQDLRFQLDEGFVFFRDTTDLLLTKEQVTQLFHKTEGWISGLKLAAISLKRSVNIAESIQRFSGQQRNISDYLLEEVLQNQSKQMRHFLLETSILSKMNRSLCQAVTGQINSQEKLDRIEQLNLFIIPLDDERNWYRYHQLLSDFLQQILSRTDPDKWMQVHIRAANWLEHHGFDLDAVEHYIEGKQVVDAVRLIEKNLHVLVQTKSVDLIRWVSVFPEDSLAEKPMIELFYIAVLLGAGEWKAAFSRVEQTQIRFQALQEKLTNVEWNQAMGNIYFFCTMTSYLQQNLERTSYYLELVEQHMPEGSFFQTMGCNRYQDYDSFDDLLVVINDLNAVEGFLLKWITAWENKQVYPFIGYFYASYCKLLYEWNRLDEAEFYVNQALGRKDIEPFARILIPIYICASRIQQAQGNTKRACDLLEQIKLKIHSPDYELFMQKIEAEQAALALQQGSNLYGKAWMQRCGLAYTDEVSLNSIAEHISLVRMLADTEQVEEALYMLKRLDNLLFKEGRLRDRIKVLILQSVVNHRIGQTKLALGQLESALLLSEPGGYIRSFVDEGPVIADILTAYLKLKQDRRIKKTSSVSMAYVKRLLLACKGSSEDELSTKVLLTEQETRILKLIAVGLSNKVIAIRLFVVEETVKSHIKNMYRKLKVNNRVQALQRAKELNILDSLESF